MVFFWHQNVKAGTCSGKCSDKHSGIRLTSVPTFVLIHVLSLGMCSDIHLTNVPQVSPMVIPITQKLGDIIQTSGTEVSGYIYIICVYKYIPIPM